MMDQSTTSEAFSSGNKLLDEALALAPKALLIIGTIIAGLVLSSLARKGVVWLVRRSGLETLCEKVGVSKMLYAVGIKQSVPKVLGQMAYYTGLMLMVATVAEALGLPGIADGIGVLTKYLPQLLAAGLIMLAGLFAADLLRSIISRISGKGEVDSPDILAQGVYYIVLAVSFTLAADHAGFETGLINSIIQIAVAAAAFGVAGAFALGSRPTFRHLVARYYAERLYRSGDRVSVSGVTGVILRFGAVSVILKTDEGEVVLPCLQLVDEAVKIERIEKMSAEASDS